MATVSYGTITVTDLTDITNVYLEYCMVEAGRTASEVKSKTTWISPEVEWSTTYPTWQSGYEIWIRQVQIKEGIDEPECGEPYLDTAVNQINEHFIEYIDSQGLNLEALNTKTRFQWRNQNNYEYGHTYEIAGEWLKPDYLMGTYAASGKLDANNNPTIDYEDSRTYGFNTYLSHNALNLRYDAVNMTTLSTGALTFYIPTQQEGEWIQGEKGLEITAEGIDIYNPNGIKGLDIKDNGLTIYSIENSLETESASIHPIVAIKQDIFTLGFDLTELTEDFDPYSDGNEEPFIVWKKDGGNTYLYEYLDDIIIKDLNGRYALKEKINTIEQNVETNTTNIININGEINDINNNIYDITSQLNKAKNDISTNADNISINADNISTNVSNISLINARINKIKAYWTINNANNHLKLIEGGL